MKLLLDTHILLWWFAADKRLSKETLEIIANPDHEVAVSAASFWEIAIKKSLRRITINLRELQESVKADRFTEVPVTFAHAVQLELLPERHRDPFDRILIAQAVAESRQLLTRDEAILAYQDVSGFAALRV